ncbi:uncharacterized protein LOC143257202 isoform X2 [Tachypleus tridentatus]|uniref:uncharacterized protein LOC143257202 isoform X2 n=1 Tax=Tachypleus tridentatus TaxID=6853 RepID=UPI003FD37837
MFSGQSVFVGTLRITEVSIPKWLENGTKESVVLDCKYSYEVDDKNLVVKWFLDNDPEPIYQWITELDLRQPSYRLQGRINMSYTVSPSTNLTRYRALNIIRPTTDLSGKYTCNVASLASEDSEEHRMTIYARPRSFDFSYNKTAEGTVNFTCRVEGVFPLPHMSMFLTNPKMKEVQSIPVYNNTKYRKGTYSTVIHRELNDRDLSSEGPSEIECVLLIPHTDFRKVKTLKYYPDHLTSCAVRETHQWISDRIYVVSLFIFNVPAMISVS